MLRPVLSVLAVALALAGAPGEIRAQPAGPIALLPLDADARLEIYGQPVASEIARALVAGGVDVVVVGPRMLVPDRAKLIVDGTIRSEKTAVVLTIRVRNPSDGTVLQTLISAAPTLANIDRAAAELSARVLPFVRDKLVALAAQPAPAGPLREPIAPTQPGASARPAIKPVLVGVGVGASASATVEPLRAALAIAAPAWVLEHERPATVVDAAALARATATKTVAESAADRALGFEILAYRVIPGIVPLARARVRVRIAGSSAIVFDRIVVTDTVVGDRAMSAAALAERVAREVLAIAHPHVRRQVVGWP